MNTVTPPASLLFLHGMGANAESWSAVRSRIDARHRSTAYDHRGHAGSPFDDSCAPTILQLGRDLATVLDGTAPDGPVVLVGHSVGGMAVLACAAERPDLFGSTVAGVVLVSTSARGMRLGCGLPGPGAALVRAAFLGLARAAALPGTDAPRRALAGVSSRGIRAMTAKRWPLYGWGASATVRRACATMITDTRPQTLHALLHQLDSHRAPTVTPLHGLPALVLVGAQDRFMPPSHSRELAALLPGAQVAIAPGVGHVLPLERPDFVAREISQFLAESIFY